MYLIPLSQNTFQDDLRYQDVSLNAAVMCGMLRRLLLQLSTLENMKLSSSQDVMVGRLGAVCSGSILCVNTVT